MKLQALTAALVLAGVAGTAGRPQTFHSGVDLVRVDALVTDGHRVIPGLRAGDFELRDNGILQIIDGIALESLPLSVTFVLDTSGSVAGAKMQYLGSAVDLILKGLREHDRAALVTFSHRVWLRTALTSDFQQVRSILAAAPAEGGTSLRDAVYAGLALSETQHSRGLVLVFSDGLDNASWLGSDTVERAAHRTDAVVYGVAVGAGVEAVVATNGIRTSMLRPVYLAGQTAFLETIASATGGRVIKADTTDNLPKAFDEILQEVAGWHSIDVKVKGRRARVRARRGYERF